MLGPKESPGRPPQRTGPGHSARVSSAKVDDDGERVNGDFSVFAFMRAVRDQAWETAADRRLAAGLADELALHADGAGQCFPGVRHIEERSGLSRNRLRQGKELLISAGFIVLTNGARGRHLYQLVCPKSAQLSRGRDSSTPGQLSRPRDRSKAPRSPADGSSTCPAGGTVTPHGTAQEKEGRGARARQDPPPPAPSASPDQEEDRLKAQEDVPLPVIEPNAYPPGHEGYRPFAKALRALAARTTNGTTGPGFVTQVLEALDEGLSRQGIIDAFVAERGRPVRRVYFRVLQELRHAVQDPSRPRSPPITAAVVREQCDFLVAALGGAHVPPLDDAVVEALAAELRAAGKTPSDLHEGILELAADPSRLNGDLAASVRHVMGLGRPDPPASDSEAVALTCRAALGPPSGEGDDEERVTIDEDKMNALIAGQTA